MGDKNANMVTRVGISGEREYKEACREMNKNISLLNSEMKLVTAEYKENANSLEALKAKQEILQKTYDEQAKKVELAKELLQEYGNAETKNADAIRKAQKELNYQKAALENTNNALKENAKQQQEAEKATSAAILAQKQYEEHCKRIDNNIKSLSHELASVTAEYKGNETSTEALGKKQELLAKIFNEQGIKVNETEEALRKCRGETGKYSDESRKLEDELNKQKVAWLEAQNALQAVETELSEGVQAQRQYEEACRGIDKNMSLLSAKLAEVTAKYKSNENGAKAVAEKQEILKKSYAEQARKVEETEKAYKSMAQQYGKNSSEAQELEIQLHKEKTALYDLDNQLNESEKGHSSLASSMGKLGEAMAKGTAAVAAGAEAIGSAVAAGIGYTIKQADEAKGALNNFCTATGTAAGEADQYRQVMENIYNGNFGEGFKDIAAAMAEVRQQAGDLGANKLEEMTTNALILRDTFDFEVAESTRAAQRLMQEFGVTSEEAYSLIAQGAQQGLNQNGDLLDVINEYSNQFAQIGYDAEDMFNMLKNGAEQGTWSIDKLGDATKEFNIRMSDGTAKDAVEALGFSWEQVCADWQKGGESAAETMNMLLNEMEGMEDTTEGYNLGVTMFGTMWEDVGYKSLLAMSQTQGEISKTIDAMSQINAVKYDTFGEAIQGTGRILQTSFIMPMGEQALPILSQFANELQKGAAEAGGNIEIMAQSFGEALNNMVSGLSEMLPQITSFAVEAINGLASGIIESQPVIIQAGVDMAVALVSGITDAIPMLAENSVKIITTLLDGIAVMLPSIAEGAVQIIAGLAEGIGQALPTLLPTITNVVIEIVNMLVQNVPQVIDAGIKLLSGIVEAIPTVITAILEALPEIITNIVQALVQSIPLIIEGAIQLLMGIVEAIPQIITALTEALPQIIDAVVTGLITGLPLIIEGAIQLFMAILEAIPEIIAALANSLPEIITAIATGLANGIPQLFIAAKDLLWQVIEAAPEVIAGLKETVPNIVQGLVNGLINGIGAVFDAAKKLGGGILDGVKEFFGIHSPSTVMAEQGDFLVQGLINGISEMPQRMAEILTNAITSVAEWGLKIQDKAREVMNVMLTAIVNIVKDTPVKIWNGIIGAVTQVATWGLQMQNKAREMMDSMLTGIVSIVTQVPQKIYNCISGAISKVAQWGEEVRSRAVEGMTNCVNGILNAFSNIGSSFAEIGGNIVSGIWNGISSGWDWLMEKVSNLANSLLGAAKSALGIESPSKKFRDEVGVFMAQGIGVGFAEEMRKVKKQIADGIPQEFDINAKANFHDAGIDDDPWNPKPKPKGGAGRPIVQVTQYIYADTTDYVKQQKEAGRQLQHAVRAVLA